MIRLAWLLAGTMALAADFNAPMGEVEKQVEANWVDGRWEKTDAGQIGRAHV